MIRVGRFDIFSVINGSIRLDGGGMFGIVPKVLWEKTEDVDAQNRILLATRTLVAIDRAERRVVIADAGAGGKWSEEEASRYAVRHAEWAVEGALGKHGIGPGDVTDVVVTHAHFDHCGGLTMWRDSPGGETWLRFPRAVHWVHEDHWRHALDPFERDAASFLSRDLVGLDRSGMLRIIEGDDPSPPFEGMRWVVSHGHTPGLLLPLVEDAAAPLLFTGDMMPTSTHLSPLWVMAHDLEPLVTIEEKKRWTGACAGGLRFAFPHDRLVAGAVIDVSGRKPRIAAPLDLAP